jgi:ribonuclease G
LHDRPEAIFDHSHIESQIAKALDRRVYLKSGGHIVIDHTEALTAIDVNTGRFVGKKDQEETMLQTNLEAAKAVVEQLRLRNIGGLIIIDFIDMERAANRNKVTEALREAQKDKTRSSMKKISELGLVQMTRKRTRESLLRQLCDPCPYCEGKGYIRSVPTAASEILRLLKKEAFRHPTAPHLVVKAHEEVITYLYDEEGERLDEIEHFSANVYSCAAGDASRAVRGQRRHGHPNPAICKHGRSCKRKSEGLKSELVLRRGN